MTSDPSFPGKEAVLCEYLPGHQRWRSTCLRTDRYKYVFSGAARERAGEPFGL